MASTWVYGIIFLVLAMQQSFLFLALASSNVHIVYMGERRHEEPELVQDSHHEILSNIIGSSEAAKESILYSYKHGFSGFAAALTESQAKQIADFPGVIRVVRNRVLNLQTTRSWDFLQVKSQIANGVTSMSQSGNGSIIGVMDTGIWPESASFNDEGMEHAPPRWKGICQQGEKFNSSHCNRKIIGARWYVKGYEAEFGKMNTSDGAEYLSPRDASGHGTHTSSTAAGAPVQNVSFMGLAQGVARGGAPSAWLAVYKVCWATGGCSSADILAAFDDAIFDGVDVLSGQAFYTGEDVNEFHPIVNGQDIAADDSDESSAKSCVSGTLNATLARGKVVLCFASRSQSSAIVATSTVLDVRGAGVIFAQFPTKDVTLTWGIPCVQIDFAIGTSLLTYIDMNRNPIVKFSPTKTAVGQQISPEVAFFSSRGPSSLSPSVLKPDIAAPGVNILASWSPAYSPFQSDMTQKHFPPLDFSIDSGTSMSCPHISGIVALLKAIHRTWSPAAIKSALVSTASLKDEYGQRTVAEGAPHKQADPFDYGGGHVDPNKAIAPGLIYDMGSSDYFHFLCSMGYNHTAISSITRSSRRCNKSANVLVNLNLPSITIPELKSNLTVSRKVTNVGPVNSIYTAFVEAPAGTEVIVKPSILRFNSTIRKLKFKVIFGSTLRVQGRYSFGNLFWLDGFHVVRIPLTVRTVIDNFYAQT
ncbi:subtilisin-like protease SBT3.7 isoform X4 [Carya illinoinensis]|uniref:Subtilisin-like protease SBT3.6 n=1 Tax=Carya illinoinensis TaxID=32201 RepID=A0A8T1QGI7_CARIL|nr:subtilisin-like protease SBT3.7 isoform X4 [Carya illinoinensis]KAG6653391.1 hypothetical protein CIPAW_05G073000 [Carya illinoinensis]